MGIKFYEFKKLLSAKVLIILMGVFIAYNFMVIRGNSDIGKEIKIANNVIKEVGSNFDSNAKLRLSILENQKMDKLNLEISKILGREFKDINELLESEEYSRQVYSKEGFTTAEEDLILENIVVNSYKNSEWLIDGYEGIDVMEIAKGRIEAYSLSGKAKKIVLRNYEKLGKRLEEIKESGQHKDLFLTGKIYKLHNFLFKDIFVKCILEIVIVVILAVSFLINYERDKNTMGVIFTSKRGRGLIKDKLIVSIVGAISISIIILGATLLIYFMTFDYSNVLGASISSAFNWDLGVPHIAWYDFSFISYLWIASIVVIIVSVLVCGITFIICNAVKSSYKTFFIFFILVGLMFMMAELFSGSSAMAIYSHYNIATLALNPHMWFMGEEVLIGGQYYMHSTLIINIIIVTILSIISVKRFRKENIA